MYRIPAKSLNPVGLGWVNGPAAVGSSSGSWATPAAPGLPPGASTGRFAWGSKASSGFQDLDLGSQAVVLPPAGRFFYIFKKNQNFKNICLF